MAKQQAIPFTCLELFFLSSESTQRNLQQNLQTFGHRHKRYLQLELTAAALSKPKECINLLATDFFSAHPVYKM